MSTDYSTLKTGPNVRRLICHKMSVDAVPPGGDFMDAVRFLQSKDAISNSCRAATEWVLAAMKAVRDAPGGEKFGDDEAIAGEILRQIEVKKRERWMKGA